jgi:hypothetical protein
MAQIFVSHSAKDTELVALLLKAFASTKVKGVFEKFEAILKGPANAARIANDIRNSNAVFVLLGKHVEELRHTRDWIGWESGFAAAPAGETNKDIWVLEPITEAAGLSVVIPHFRHYVCFDPSHESTQGYLTRIIGSYDDSRFLKAMSAGAVTGGVVGAGAGAILGAGAGLMVAAFSSTTRPPGAAFRCLNPNCLSIYTVHLCANWMRCPVCNSRWVFQ